MPSPGAEAEVMLVRTTVVSLALQALVGQLVLKGVLDKADLLAMRKMGLQLAADLRLHGGTNAQIAGDWMEREVADWWDTAETLDHPPSN